MIIAISCMGKQEDTLMDARFGRCMCFAFYNTQTDEYKLVENNGTTAQGGAGIAAAQQVVNEKAEVVITGFLGPNAMRVLQSANIKAYRGKGQSISEEIKSFNEGKLETLETAQPAHFGMGNGNGFGRRL